MYRLSFASGMIYIGQSHDIDNRIKQHREGSVKATCTLGADFVETDVYTLPILHDLEAWERSETLYNMHKHGIHNVRGWRYTKLKMTKTLFKDAQTQISEKYNLCRKCGQADHFISQCATAEKTKSARSHKRGRLGLSLSTSIPSKQYKGCSAPLRRTS